MIRSQWTIRNAGYWLALGLLFGALAFAIFEFAVILWPSWVASGLEPHFPFVGQVGACQGERAAAILIFHCSCFVNLAAAKVPVWAWTWVSADFENLRRVPQTERSFWQSCF